MLEDINRELARLQQELGRRQGLRADLGAAEAGLRRERARLSTLGAELARKRAAVARLEGPSLRGLWHALLGNKGDRLIQAREEALAAELEHGGCRGAVSALEREVSHLRAQLRELDGLERRYQELLAQKEAALAAAAGEEAQRLAEIGRELAGARAEIRELEEAIAAGGGVLGGLREVTRALDSASNWGVWDMLGGGLLTTMAKHSRLDEARAAARGVQQQLRSFQRELADVTAASSDLDIDVGSFATFADYFFDGLLADWVVQSRIGRARERVARLQEQVQAIKSRLERRLAASRQRVADLEAARQRLLAES